MYKIIILVTILTLPSCILNSKVDLINKNSILGILIGSDSSQAEKKIGENLIEEETRCFTSCISTYTAIAKYDIFKEIDIKKIIYRFGSNGFYSVKIHFSLDEIEKMIRIIESYGITLQKISDSYSFFVESIEVKLLPSAEYFHVGELNNLIVYINRGDTYGIMEIYDKTYVLDEIEIDNGIESFKSELNKLYEELLSFKDVQRFKEIGFATHGPYNNWLLRVDNARSRYEKAFPTLNNKQVHFYDLTTLGLEYVFTKGHENSLTIKINSEITEALK